ncbi:MAG: hypothetical protein COA69_13480 [Robiginitomaculum sp.]|nr:MAG: hypothetical protein COA69_13480 [Robiginitomaculum sp.]
MTITNIGTHSPSVDTQALENIYHQLEGLIRAHKHIEGQNDRAAAFALNNALYQANKELGLVLRAGA